MAKLAATEGAQQVIDAAVQIGAASGCSSGRTVERLYREIRALRIYEGASEVQQLIIGRDLLKAHGQRRRRRMRNEALLPEGWPRPKGYANGVAATGRQVHVAGQVGWTPEGVWESDDSPSRPGSALANVAAVLRAGGGRAEAHRRA